MTAYSNREFHVLDWGNIEYENPKWRDPDGVHPNRSGQMELDSLEPWI